MPLLSIVTTCKGRLDHLKQTLPSRLALPDSECIVVDYDCPQGTADWVARHHPAAKLVRVADRPTFSASEARNLGARAASGEWLLFLDADIGLAPGLVEALRPILAPGQYYLPRPRRREAWGTLLVRRTDFAAAQGYDETFEGWGSEDDDLSWRLKHTGLTPADMPGSGFRPLQHAEADRTRFHAIRARDLNSLINIVYMAAKRDLLRLGAPVDEPLRRQLYRDVRQRLLERASPQDSASITVSFRRTTAEMGHIDTQLTYRVTPIPPEARERKEFSEA